MTKDLHSETKWWEKYRDLKHRARKHMNFDTILWKSFKETMKEYVKQSSLSGIRQIFGEGVSMTYRLIWAALMLIACFVFGYYLKYLASDNISNPLIVTMASSTYPISDIDFPAVAICNINRISKKAVAAVARDIQGTMPYFRNVSIEHIKKFVQQTGRLLDFRYDDDFRNHFENLINSPNRATFDSDHVINRMEQLAPNCSEILLRCAWASTRVECSDVFMVRRTARGHCCVFNYVLEYNSAGNKDSSINVLDKVKKQKQAGYNHGLALILDPLINDYAYTIRSLEGFEIFIFDPTYYPDPTSGRFMHRTTQANEVMYYELRSTKQEAAPEVRKYPDDIRKCRFKDERFDEFKNMYSYGACLIQCRIRTFVKLCRCVPYFIPTHNEAPICTFDDLHCLFKFRDKFFYLYPRIRESSSGLEEELQDSLDCPECLPDCEFTRYDTKSFWSPAAISPANKGLNYFFFNGIDMTNKCAVTVYQPTADGVLDRLDVVSYWYELLSNTGGMAGVLVGFSLLCTLELIYFFVRFIVAFWINVKMYH